MVDTVAGTRREPTHPGLNDDPSKVTSGKALSFLAVATWSGDIRAPAVWMSGGAYTGTTATSSPVRRRDSKRRSA